MCNSGRKSKRMGGSPQAQTFEWRCLAVALQMLSELTCEDSHWQVSREGTDFKGVHEDSWGAYLVPT